MGLRGGKGGCGNPASNYVTAVFNYLPVTSAGTKISGILKILPIHSRLPGIIIFSKLRRRKSRTSFVTPVTNFRAQSEKIEGPFHGYPPSIENYSLLRTRTKK